jgi:double-stranded uracil-DNA glycosylase
MPSVISLAKGEYYAHPRNAFWPIMGRLLGAGPEVPYKVRRRLLQQRKLAVWDVLGECHRAGSLDTAIDAESEMPNDFAAFFRQHRRIQYVFFNGTKAETAYRRHALANVEKLGRQFSYTRLPSTSPAHAGRTLDEKLTAWRAVADALTI